jgi:hypothetical protein
MSKLDTFETTDQVPEQTAPQEQPPAGPPKSQLRRRVDARIAELEAVLERLNDDPAKHKQIRAIHMALKGAHDTMNLSSNRTGHMEAQLMTRWLESTQYLTGTKS